MKKVIHKLLELLFRAAAVTLIMIPIAEALIAAAYAERGYSAVGGEWLAIIAMAAALWYLSRNALEHITSDPSQQEESEEP